MIISILEQTIDGGTTCLFNMTASTKKSSSGSIFNYLLIVIAIIVGGFKYLQQDINALLKFSDFVTSFDKDIVFYNTHNNSFLNGNFAPVNEENVNIPMKVVQGQLPTDINGLFLRIGPNPIPHHNTRRHHWFDGHGMIHSVRVQAGQAYYSNQWIKTFMYETERKYDQPVFFRFGELGGLLGLFKVMVVQPLILKYFKIDTTQIGQANTAMLLYNNKLYACHEGSLMYEIQWQQNNSFKSIGYDTFNNIANYPINAHSKVDPYDGKLYFSGYNFQPNQPTYKTGSLLFNNISTYYPVETAIKSWAHDMMITEHYFLHFESSIQFDPKQVMKGKVFSFNNNHTFKIGVSLKQSNTSEEITWYSFDKPYGVIHPLNAWEDMNEKNEKIIYLWTPVTDRFDIDLEETNSYYMMEFMINLSTQKTSTTIIDTKYSIEFPRIHPQFLGRKATYGYAGNMKEDGLFEGVVKYDFINKKVDSIITLPSHLRCGEIIPIPKKISTITTQKGKTIQNQDNEPTADGVYLATFVYNVDTQGSEWHVYDGTTMQSTPLAVLSTGDKRVPYGFHAEWIPENKLQDHMNSHSNTVI